MWKRIAVLVLLLSLAASPARAWDDTGHMVVAFIAWQHMTPETRTAVSRILQNAPPRSDLLDLRPAGSAQADMIHFIRASYWPDLVRNAAYAERRERYHRGAWHHGNLYWEETADGGVRIREDLEPAAEYLVERIGHLEMLARHSLVATAQKAVIIAWLVHLVGDIHQPLHTGSRVTEREPEGDRGGTLFRLGEEDNLHFYWDRALSEAFEREVGESELAYVRRIATSLMSRHVPPDDVDFDYEAWADRGFQIASRDAYAEIERGQEPPVAYQEMTQAAAAESIGLAGYRLAALMNSIFG